jgi:DNA-binding transcriptional regulator YbjK
LPSGRYARGQERSEALLAAVIRVIARDGVSGVTHRAVATEARVSLRSTTYYFESKETMIREALCQFVRQNVTRADAVARVFPSKKSKLESAVDAIASVMLDEMNDPDWILRTEYELVLAISREPAYAPEYHELQELLELRLRALMAAIGSDDPRRHARLVLAVSRGFQYERLAEPEVPPSARALRSHLRALLIALVPSCEHESF